MRPSLLTYFAWISLVFMVAISCRSSRISIPGEQARKLYDSISSGSFEKLSIKAKVIFHGQELSGIMLFKNSGDCSYKIAFYNELGMTYLEGILETSSKHIKLSINNMTPILNNKLFINNFENSLQTLFSPDKNNLQLIEGNGFKDEKLIIRLHSGFELELSITSL
jgi:hypothetical protein